VNFDTRHSLPGPDIEVVQGAGLDADQDFTRPRRGLRKEAIFELLEPAVFPEKNSAHHPIT
jgi:hypothetical protein